VDDPQTSLKMLNDLARRPIGMSDAQIEAVRRTVAFWGGLGGTREDAVRALNTALDRDEDTEANIRLLWTLGAHEDAYRRIETYAVRSHGINPNFLFSANAVEIRKDPRFMPVAARLGLLAYWRKTGHWPDFCTGPAREVDCQAAAAKAGV
jgi:hypothetical protein